MSKTAAVIFVAHERHFEVPITKNGTVGTGDSNDDNQLPDATHHTVDSSKSVNAHVETSHLQDAEAAGRKLLGLQRVTFCETAQLINSFVDVLRFVPVTSSSTSRVFRSQCGTMDGIPVMVKIVEKGIRDRQLRQEFHTLISIHRELLSQMDQEEPNKRLPPQSFGREEREAANLICDTNNVGEPTISSTNSCERSSSGGGSNPSQKQPLLRRLTLPTSLCPSEVLQRIVKPLRLLETESELALVMERLEGPDLCQYLLDHRQGRLSEDECRLVVYNALLILKAIHSLGFVHRDVTLPNLVLRDANNLESLSLVDFGIAGRMDLPEEMIRMCGSPGSCAPEILLGSNKGPHFEKLDVFSLGVVLFTILSGSPPFIGKSPIVILRLNCRAEVSFHKTVWEHVSVLAKDLTTRMTERDPTLRISVMEALEHEWFDILRKPSSRWEMEN